MLVGEEHLGGYFMWFSRGCKITTEVEGKRAVLFVEGKVTIGVGDLQLREAIYELIDQGLTDIVLDLGDVKDIDSSGIGELVAAYTNVTNAGGHLKLRRLPPKIQDILDILDIVNTFSFPDFPDFPDGFAC
jgi:anti-sigma B factor antagonist